MQFTSYRSGVVFSLILNIVSKGLLFIVNLSIAYFFGASPSTDLYFFLLGIILMSTNVVLGLTGSVIIPEFMRKEVEEGIKRSQAMVNRVIGIVLIFTLIIVGAIFIRPISVFSFISNFNQDVIQSNFFLIRLSLVVLLVQVSCTLLNEILISRKYFIIPSLIAIINSVFTILFVVAFYKSYGIKSIFLANIIALSMSLVAQMLILIKWENWEFSITSKHNFDFDTNYIYGVGSIIISSISAFFPIYLLSQFVGTLTEFNFAQRVSEIPNSLLVIQFASIVAIKLNNHFANNELELMNNSIGKSSKILLSILIPTSLVIFVFSKEITNLFFINSSLTHDSLMNVSSFISILILSIPFVGLSYLITKVLMAIRRLKEVVFFQLIMTVINGIFVFVGVHFFESVGYAWGYILYQVCYTISLYYILKRLSPYISFLVILKHVFYITILSVPLLFFILFLMNKMRFMFSEYLYMATSVGIFAIALLTINYVLKFNEDIIMFQKELFNKVNSILRK